MFLDDYDRNNRFHLYHYIDEYYISLVDLGIDMDLFSSDVLHPLRYELMIFLVRDNEIDFSSLYGIRFRDINEAQKFYKKTFNLNFIKKIIK